MTKVLSAYNVTAENFIPVSGHPDQVCFFPKTTEKKVVEIPLPLPPAERCGMRITVKLSADSSAKDKMDVFSSEVCQNGKVFKSSPVRSFTAGDEKEFRSVTLESCLLIESAAPLRLFITRRTADEADTFQGTSVLTEVEIAFLSLPEGSVTVENSPGYNSWPMCQSIGSKIVCAYSRGCQHDIFEPERAVYARVSSDGGRTWEEETTVCNTPGRGDVAIGKGLDEKGNMLLWVRHSGHDGFRHRLYRSTDGKNFGCVCDMELPRNLIQITDIFHVPGAGLTALWFAGSYGPETDKSWGTLTSSDNGSTWEYTVLEKDLDKTQWPTEPCAVCLGNGKILAIARTESHEDSTRTAQFQLTSCDHGRTWHKERTNITDVNISTPSLIYDPGSGQVFCYYFYRGRGILNCRTADAEYIFDHPLSWPAPETAAVGSCEVCEAGNVNAVSLNGHHILSYYSGAMPDTAIFVKSLLQQGK